MIYLACHSIKKNDNVHVRIYNVYAYILTRFYERKLDGVYLLLDHNNMDVLILSYPFPFDLRFTSNETSYKRLL